MLPTLIAAAMIPNLVWFPIQGFLTSVHLETKLCVESHQPDTLMVFDAENMTCHDVPYSILRSLPYVEIEEQTEETSTPRVDMQGVI